MALYSVPRPLLRQAELYMALVGMQQEGNLPSYRELVEHTHLTSKSQIGPLIVALKLRGVVIQCEERQGAGRSIRVTAQPVGELRDDQPLDAFAAAVARIARAPYRLRIGCRTLEHLHICAGDLVTISPRPSRPGELVLCCESTLGNPVMNVHPHVFMSPCHDELGVVTTVVRIA